MKATPLTDEFASDFELALFRILPESLLTIKGYKLKDDEILPVELKNAWEFKNRQEQFLNSLSSTKEFSGIFWVRTKPVIAEAEQTIPADDILRWVHIFRVKYEKSGALLSETSKYEKDGLYWKMFYELADKGEIEKDSVSGIVSLIEQIIMDCKMSWSALMDFFESCKKMAQVPETHKSVSVVIDHFSEYKKTLIPKYISQGQETELRNLLKVNHAPNRINWLGSLPSLVTTVQELEDKGAIVIAEGITQKQYILYNFTHKNHEINSDTLANALSKRYI